MQLLAREGFEEPQQVEQLLLKCPQVRRRRACDTRVRPVLRPKKQSPLRRLRLFALQ